MTERMKNRLLSRKAGKADGMVFAIWVILVCIIRYFHEPWFDEMQAWEIARFASVKEILFEVTHYEGHPQLWHLLLMPFARMELPAKATIFCINLIFSGGGVLYLLYRSPFPRILRWYLPFTYYIFYLHSVHTRPYCMTMLAFFLLAAAFPERNQKPGKYVGCMIFLCFTTVYGVIFSCGFCLVWVWEIFQEYQKKKNVKDIIKDKRFYWLIVILMAALFILCCTLPAEDNYNGRKKLTWAIRLERLYYVPLIFFDCTFGTVMLEDESLEFTGTHILGAVIGAIQWAVWIPLLKKNRKLLLCIVPYLIGAIFCAFVYFGVHHLEVFQLLFIFILWVMFAEGIEMPEIYGKIRKKIDSQMTIKLLKAVSAMAICAPVIYTIGSAVLEIRYRYGPQEMADFVKNNHLEDRKIMIQWGYEMAEDDSEDGVSLVVQDETLPMESYPPIAKQLTYFMGDAATVYAYADRDADFFTYFNIGESQRKWMIWKDQTPEQLQETFEKWQEIGLPDFIFGSVPIQEAFTEEQLEGVTYYWIDDLHYGKIWKLDYTEGVDHVYIREDLLEEYPQFEIKKYATILTKPEE